jgi:hypothetical protein
MHDAAREKRKGQSDGRSFDKLRMRIQLLISKIIAIESGFFQKA